MAAERRTSDAIARAAYPILREAGGAVWEALDAGLIPSRPGFAQWARDALEARPERRAARHLRSHDDDRLARFLEPECRVLCLYADWMLANEPNRPTDALSSFDNRGMSEGQRRVLEVARTQACATACSKLVILLTGLGRNPEVIALRWLAVRRHWALNELPPRIDANVLRCLDDAEHLEARYVGIVNADPTGAFKPTEQRGEWISPTRQPRVFGDWDMIWECRNGKHLTRPPEVRVTDKGKAALARLSLKTDTLSSPGPRPNKKRKPSARSARTPGQDEVRLDERKLQRAQADVHGMRTSKGGIYPGQLLVTKPGSSKAHPVEDGEFDSRAQRPAGIALWAPTDKASASCCVVEGQQGDVYVPVIAADSSRPRVTNPRVELWILRADAARLLGSGRARRGLPKLSPEQWAAVQASLHEDLRRQALNLIPLLSPEARQARVALGRVADAGTPDPDQLASAIAELYANAPGQRISDIEQSAASSDKMQAVEHSPDFSTVQVDGVRFELDAQARKVVSVLFDEARRSDEGIAVYQLGTKIGSSATRFRVETCFRGKGGVGMNPAYAVLVEKYERGLVRLNEEVARKWRAE